MSVHLDFCVFESEERCCSLTASPALPCLATAGALLPMPPLPSLWIRWLLFGLSMAPLWSLVPPAGDTFLIHPPLQGDEMRRKKKNEGLKDRRLEKVEGSRGWRREPTRQTQRASPCD